MAEFRRMILTDKGQHLIAKLISGSSGVQFTRIALSSDPYGDAEIPALTALTGIKQTAPVSRTTKLSTAAVKLEGAITNDTLSTGYTLNSIGVYAQDPDEGEILYSVAGANVPGFVPAYNGITVSGVYVTVTTTVSNADNVSLTVDPAAVATIGNILELEKEISDLRAFVGYSDPDVYGVEVDFQNRRFVRLAAAEGKTAGTPFDGIRAFGGRRRCNLTDGGVVTAYYGDAAYTETGKLTAAVTVDGNTFPVGTAVQVMVEQPAFYYKVVPMKAEVINGGKGFHIRKARYYISDTMKAGFKLHPAFISNGKERAKIYLSAFEGCLWDASANAYCMNDSAVPDANNDKLSSIGGAKPVSGKPGTFTRDTARKTAQKRGAGWNVQYCATASLSQMLMLIEYAAFNMQTAIGDGAVYKTDDGASNMAEPTGATTNLGNRSGAVINGNNIQIVTYRGEENLWGNIWKFVDGMNIQCSGIHELYVADHGFADDTMTGAYINAGITLPKANGYVSAMAYSEAFDWLFVPSEVAGDSALPVGDHFWQNNTANTVNIAVLGASWNGGLEAGPFCWNVHDASSGSYRTVGARPVYVPA